MASGKPNDSSKLLNFVAKVYDPVAKDYKPVYEAPDATDKVYGDVLLSDAVDSTLNAATGVTAATPMAVKTVQDNANNKLDKTATAAQTVTSAITFNGAVTGKAGFVGNLTGNVTGNAATATKLATARTISAQVGNDGAKGSVTFNGSSDVSIVIPSIKASNVAANSGTLPISVIPQGALDRLVHVADEAARFALTTDSVQTGDTVMQDDTGVMYIVVNDAQLGSDDGYQEYKASTAMKALEADKAATADKLTTARTISIDGSVTGSGSFDGSGNLTISTTTSHNHDGSYLPITGGELSGSVHFKEGVECGIVDSLNDDEHVFTFRVLDSGATIASRTSSNGLFFATNYDNNTVFSSLKYDSDNDLFSFSSPIKGTLKGLADNVQDDAITLAKLASDVGTVAVSDEEPTDSNVLIWIDTSEDE